MILKFYNPRISSQRNLILISNFNLRKNPLIKTELKGLKKSNGRNNQGKITVFSKGGGKKQKYRNICFNNNSFNGIITSIEYDPNRTANIISIFDNLNNKYFYKLCAIGQKIGDKIEGNSEDKNFLGYTKSFEKIPVGSFIFNVSLKANEKSKYIRSAGTFGLLLKKTLLYCIIKFNSNNFKKTFLTGFASLGIVSNELKFLTSLSKAGRSRWLNKRPNVRGVAMNPVDHPHGGGEGKTSGGRPSVNFWGKRTK